MFLHRLLPLLLLLTSGCVRHKGEERTNEDSDDFYPSAIEVPRPAMGYLIIHTARTLSHADDVPRMLHTPYDVYDQSGRRVAHVENALSFSDEGPTVVELPPGSYLVRTESPRAKFPVTVAAGRTSEIDAVATVTASRAGTPP